MVVAYDEAVVSCTESTRSGVGIGMICSVLGATPPQIKALRATPSLVRDLVLVVHDNRWKALLEDVIRHTPAERQAELVARQTRFEQSPAGSELAARTAQARGAIAAAGPIENVLDLGRAWPMLHFLMTGNVGGAGSPGDLLPGGENIGDELGGLGQGRACLHDAAQTREFSRLLEGQDVERLKARVDLDAMVGLGVCAVPDGPDYESELREEVGVDFPRLRDYVGAMADKGNGLLVWVL